MKKVLAILSMMFVIVQGSVAGAATRDLGEELLGKVMEDDLAGVKQLLKKGADVNYQDSFSGSTPLMMACTYGFQDIAEALIAKGADVNLQSKDGTTALIGAAGRHPEIVKLLLDHDADLTLTRKTGTGPLTESLVGVLTDRVTFDLPELLLAKGAEVDEAPTSGDAEGYTGLIMAAKNGHLELVKWLVEHKANVKVKAKDGTTPMSAAKENGNKKVIAFLKKHGAK